MGETKDRHREGYYKEYVERTGKKDRHSADYYKKYRERKKLEKEASSSSSVVSSAESSTSSSISNTETKKKAKAKKDRRAYYREYNKKHPERLNRGYTKGCVNGNASEGEIYGFDAFGIRILGYDELGRPITNDPFGDMLRNKEMEWHDDDWCEEPD